MRTLRTGAWVGALFLGLALLWLHPVWSAPHEVLNEIYDARLNAWILAWDAHALLDPEARLFDANIFHPHGDTLAYSENLLATALLVAPFNWAGEPILAYNVALLLAFVLTGVATTFWVRSLTGSLGGGLVAGVAFTFGASRADHLPHLQLLTIWWIPLLLLAFQRWVATRRTRWLLAAAALGVLQFASGIQATLVFAPALAILVASELLHAGDRPWDAGRTVRDLALAAAIGIAGLLPLALPYLAVAESEGFVRTLRETRAYSAQPESLLAPSDHHKSAVAGWFRARYRVTEGNHFPGLTVLGLLGAGSVAAVARRRRLGGRGGEPEAAAARGPASRRHGLGQTRTTVHRITRAGAMASGAVLGIGLLLARFSTRPELLEPVLGAVAGVHPALWLTGFSLIAILTWRAKGPDALGARWVPPLLVAALVSFLLAMGPAIRGWEVEVGSGPFAWLWEVAVPYRSIRAVGRFGIATSFCLAVVAGIFAARGLRRIGDRRTAVAVTLVLLAASMAENRVWPLDTRNALPPDLSLFDALAELPGDGAVLHLPLSPGPSPPYASLYELASTRHWKPLVNGYSGFTPLDIAALAGWEPLSAPFLQYLESALAVDWIVIHRSWLDPGQATELARRAAELPQLESVYEHPTGTIYRHRPTVRRGPHVSWRFRFDQLRGVSALVAEIRANGEGAADTPVQWVLNGSEVTRTRVGPRWQEVVLPVPEDLQPMPDGSVRLLARPLDRLPGPANDLVVDAQDPGRSLALADHWLEIERRAPLLAVELDPDSDLVRRRFTADLGPAGAARLAEWVATVPQGAWIALAVRAPGQGVVEDPQLIATLRELGADLPDDAAFRALALLGTRALEPGEASLDVSGSRATAAVSRRAPDTVLAVRDLRRRGAER